MPLKSYLSILTLFLIASHAFGSEYVISEIIKQFAQSANDTTVDDKQATNPADAKTTINTSVSSKSPQETTANGMPQTNENHTNFLLNVDLTSILYKIAKVIFIILCSCFAWYVINHIIQGYFKKIRLFKKVSENSSINTQSMIKTIVPIIKSIIHWTLIIVTGLMIINVFVDITPLFFGIGVVGVALTIGSQTLIKDIVNGILLLFDGNVSVGDVVTIGNRTGTVESISLRALLLRHFTGELQTIPLSEVTAVINCSRDYSLAGIEFVVDPKAQIPSIQSAINATFKSIKHHPKYGSYIIGNLGDLGIKKMSEIGVTIKVNIPIKPDPKKDFIAEFNRQLYEQLQANEVPLAYARV